MEGVKPPDAVSWTGNVDCEWRTFKQRFLLYLQALGLDSKPDARKIALLLTVAGPQALEVYNTFVYADGDDKNKFDTVIQKFDEHCSPKNETFERYVFRSRTQQPAESFDAFLTDLKLKARTCNFGVLQHSMIRDQIVFGIKDTKVRERLLCENELTLSGAVNICHASELALQHAKTFRDVTKSGETDVAVVAGVSKWTPKRKVWQTKLRKDSETFNCKRCGSCHAPKQCPAYGTVCNKCRGQNHFAKQCFTKGKQNPSERVHTVEETDLSDSFFVDMVTEEDIKEKEMVDKWTTALEINGTIMLDTGAKVNLINEHDLRAMKVNPRIHRNAGQLINTKACPHCRFQYALTKGGCMHFSCSQCRYQFCSGCNNPYHKTVCKTPQCNYNGLHAHHPRDCLFYLRDWEPNRLQALLQRCGVDFNTDPSNGTQTNACGVIEQKDEGGRPEDSECGIQTEPGQAGLCEKHYREYLVSLINAHSLDPALLYEPHELIRACERYLVDRQRADNEEDNVYHARLLKKLMEVPLGEKVPRNKKTPEH